MNAPSARRVWSAGGVVWRRAGGRVEIVLVARPAEGLWALPKGKPLGGESVEQTALREVAEETGLEVAIDEAAADGGRLGAIRYVYGGGAEPERVHKEVHHFLMRAAGGDVSRHDAEHDLVAWYDIHEAAERMTYANERAIVERAQAALANGAAP